MVRTGTSLAYAFLFALAFLIPRSSDAGDFKVYMDYACLGIDGVPIPRSSALATSCCGGNATAGANYDTCTAGFFSIIPDSMVEAENLIEGAYNLINQSIEITGNSSNLSSTPAVEQSNPTQSSTSSDSVDTDVSALFSVPESLGKAKSGATPAQASLGRSQGSGGTSVGGGFGADSGGLGLSSDRSWKSKRGSSAGTDSDLTGAYLPNGAQKPLVTASNGALSVTSSLGEGSIEYGKGTSAGIAAEEGELSDSVQGSAEDAPDYLKRIHAKDSIFKIVSKRYQKEVARKHVEATKKK